jgi:hypothetical protein
MSDDVQQDEQCNDNLPIQVQSPLPVDVEGSLQWWNDYQRLTKELIDESDYDPDGKKKKSAWRKYGTAFQITIEKVSKEILRDDDGRVITAEWEVEAIATNGRRMPGYGACSIWDKAHDEDKKDPKTGRVTCQGPCDGRKHFTHPEHDVPSTAYTRAVNRAIADMIGAGEVSAEEIGQSKGPVKTADNGKKTIKTRQRPGNIKDAMKDKKSDKNTVPDGVDPDSVQDAQITTKKDEPETVDMSGVNLETLLGINKNLDSWIKTCHERDEPKTEKQVCAWCEGLLDDKKLTMEEFKQVRRALGHDVK